jgi:hypothetical protein
MREGGLAYVHRRHYELVGAVGEGVAAGVGVGVEDWGLGFGVWGLAFRV